MEFQSPETKGGQDRIATVDEVRTAISLFPEYLAEVPDQSLWEVHSDLGGFLRIDLQEIEIVTLRGPKTRAN